MKLTEIINNSKIIEDNFFNGDQPSDPQDISFDVAYSRPVGTFNGLEIWGSKYFGKDIDVYGILNKERDIISWAAFDNTNNNYLKFIRAYSKEKGKNHILTIMNFLIEKLKQKIIITSNEVTSTSSRNMLLKWTKLTPQFKHFSMKFFDNDEEIFNYEDALKDNVKNNIRIVMEDVYNRTLPLFGTGKRVLSDVIWY